MAATPASDLKQTKYVPTAPAPCRPGYPRVPVAPAAATGTAASVHRTR